GDLLVELGRAGGAHAALAVPADRPAYPLAAPVALLEVRGHLLGRLAQRPVAGPAPAAVAQPLGVPAEPGGPVADLAADQVTAELEQAAAEPGDRVLERGRVSVAAPHAEELELVSLPRRAVVVVVGERHHRRHCAGPLPTR